MGSKIKSAMEYTVGKTVTDTASYIGYRLPLSWYHIKDESKSNPETNCD